MIFLKISGGLGNQMFQYAAALQLAIKYNTEIGIDLQDIQTTKNRTDFTERHFELEKLFDLRKFNKVDPNKYGYLTSQSILNKIKRKFLCGEAYFEKSLLFDEKFFNISKNAYIEGYFQSEKYFLEIKDQIKTTFKFTQKPNISSINILNEIRENKSIAVHIRRGDYVSNKVINEIHGSCSISYYEKAISKFDLNTHKLYLFSDDINWVKKNFTFISLDKCNFIDWNTGEESWQDMYLMSQCENLIIANSSFSWWAAWLCENNNKKVIAPEKWFNDKNKNKQTLDLIPASWIKI